MAMISSVMTMRNGLDEDREDPDGLDFHFFGMYFIVSIFDVLGYDI